MDSWLPSRNQAMIRSRQTLHTSDLALCKKIPSKILLSWTRSTRRKTEKSQYAYRAGKNHWGCCSCQQVPFSAAKMEDVAETCIGRDLSKSFDKLDSVKLLLILKQKLIGTDNIGIIKRFHSNTPFNSNARRTFEQLLLPSGVSHKKTLYRLLSFTSRWCIQRSYGKLMGENESNKLDHPAWA